MTEKDYYQILNVGREAGEKEIKEAYRKLALEYHPDRNRGDPAAASRMKEINEAYAVLSHAEKKRQYDSLWHAYGASAHDHFRNTYSEQDIFRGSDIQQIFEEISRAFGFRGFHDIFRETYGPNYRSFEFRRPAGFGRVFVSSFGGNGQNAGNPFLQGLLGRAVRYGLKKKWGIELPEKGKDLSDMITVSPALALRGGKIDYVNRSLKRELIVTIPSGMKSGQRIRLRGIGGKGRGGGAPGDLYLKVQVRSSFAQKVHDIIKRLGAVFFRKAR